MTKRQLQLRERGLLQAEHRSGMTAEELLAAVAAATGERVCVPAERWALLEMLGLPAARLFTTDTQAARIHAVLRHSVGALPCCITRDALRLPILKALAKERISRARAL